MAPADAPTAAVDDPPCTLRPGDGRYPPALARLEAPPASLRLLGSLGASAARVALVGARASDEYGRDTARRLARGLARSGVSIVSGGARGVDEAAHEGALEAGGHTLVVLGCGLRTAIRGGARQLMRRVLEGGGGLLSEYDDDELATRWTFPNRNRIVSGLSAAVVVVRAGPRSGALITARHARVQGVPVLAVPGDVDQELAAGPNGLLREGARLAATVEDVLGFIGLAPGTQAALPALPPPAAGGAGSRELAALLAALDATPRYVGEVARAAGLAPGLALAGLLGLELRGLCEQRPGHRFLRRSA